MRFCRCKGHMIRAETDSQSTLNLPRTQPFTLSSLRSVTGESLNSSHNAGYHIFQVCIRWDKKSVKTMGNFNFAILQLYPREEWGSWGRPVVFLMRLTSCQLDEKNGFHAVLANGLACTANPHFFCFVLGTRAYSCKYIFSIFGKIYCGCVELHLCVENYLGWV